jgi:hypothetical protein
MLANALQAMNLRAKLERLAKLENAVWVTSPLTRAVETFLLSCPKGHLLKPGVPQSTSAACIKVCLPLQCTGTQHLKRSAVIPAAMSPGCTDLLPSLQVAIRPELAEHLVTTGDIGMPRAWLEDRFPEVCLCSVPILHKYMSSNDGPLEIHSKCCSLLSMQ